MLGRLDSRYGAVDGCAQRDHAVLIGKGDLDHCHVAGKRAAAVELLRFSKMDRKIVGPAGVDVGPYIGTHEKALVEENADIALLAVGSRSFGVEMVEMEILNFTGIGPPAEGGNECVGNACYA